MDEYNKEVIKLQEDVQYLLQKAQINPKEDIYYGNNTGNGSLEINITKDSSGWHWLEIERGMIQKDKITSNENEILYWIVKQSIRSKAGESVNWTSKSKHKNPRKKFFYNSIKLMEVINIDWAKKLKAEYAEYD